MSGLDSVTQRIREIQSRLAELGVPPAPEAPSVAGASGFNQILDDKLQPITGVSDINNMTAVVEGAAKEVGLDPSLAKAVAKAESGFDPTAVSKSGALGLMQLMPDTAQSLGVKSALDPQDNARGGTKYLSQLLEKYHSVPNALAAYNAGPGNVDKYGGIPPFPETQSYVNRVLQYRDDYQQEGQ